MKRFGLRCAAYAVTAYERFCQFLRLLRHLWLLTLVESGPRDMMLLTNGEWTDARRSISVEHIQWIFSSETTTLRRPTDDPAGRTERWSWLSVSGINGRDYSHFFETIRLARGSAAHFPVAKILTLMTHQTGLVPTGALSIVTRDGTEIQVDARTGEPTVAASDGLADGLRRAAELDFVR